MSESHDAHQTASVRGGECCQRCGEHLSDAAYCPYCGQMHNPVLAVRHTSDVGRQSVTPIEPRIQLWGPVYMAVWAPTDVCFLLALPFVVFTPVEFLLSFAPLVLWLFGTVPAVMNGVLHWYGVLDVWLVAVGVLGRVRFTPNRGGLSIR